MRLLRECEIAIFPGTRAAAGFFRPLRLEWRALVLILVDGECCPGHSDDAFSLGLECSAREVHQVRNDFR
jgi:hypothetical protein